MIISTSIFRNDFDSLTKRPKDGYSNCLQDIKDIICGPPFREICNLDDLLLRTPTHIVRKIRIPNSSRGEGKRYGYRLIILCEIETEKIYLLCVYPKAGKFSASDLTLDGVDILVNKLQAIADPSTDYESICDPAPILVADNIEPEIES